MPSAIAPSVPGRGLRWISALAATPVAYGSTTISFAPRSFALYRNGKICGFVAVQLRPTRNRVSQFSAHRSGSMVYWLPTVPTEPATPESRQKLPTSLLAPIRFQSLAATALARCSRLPE